jgi:hypothetical protein
MRLLAAKNSGLELQEIAPQCIRLLRRSPGLSFFVTAGAKRRLNRARELFPPDRDVYSFVGSC